MEAAVGTGAEPAQETEQRAGCEGRVHHVAACLDRSTSAEAALVHAHAVARACEAILTILHVLEPPTHLEPSHVETNALQAVDWEVCRKEAAVYLEEIAGRGTKTGNVAPSTAVVEGDPAVQICRWVEANGVDLAIVSTHGGKGRTQWSLASTTQKLIEGLSCSVLVVPAIDGEQQQKVRYARVLVPVDGSSWSESVLALSACLAEEHGGELVLAHVVPSPELTRVGPLSPEDLDLQERIVRRNLCVARDYLERLRARLSSSGLAVRTVLVPRGDVREELLRVITAEDPDLVVLSSCGSSGRIERPLGTVAAHLLTHARKPLLVVRPPREARRDHTRAERCEPRVPRFPAQATL